VVVVRKGQEQVKSVTLGRLEDNDRQQQAGLNQPPAEAPSVTRPGPRPQPVEHQRRGPQALQHQGERQGRRGHPRRPELSAADKRIQPGDVVVEVGQEPVATPADVTRRLDQLKKDGRKSALLLVSNAQGEVRFVALSLDKD
jgi:serine protease Do